MEVFLCSDRLKINPLRCQNYFFEWRRFVLTGLFHLHLRKWISDVTRTNAVFDVEAGNRKLGSFWRRLWWERTAQKEALCLTPENHVVWRHFPLNSKISHVWLRAWWSSIRYPNSIAGSSIRKEIFIIAERRQFFQVFYRGIAMLRT